MTTNSPSQLLALDVGEKRIGVAQADTLSRIPFVVSTLTVDGTEHAQLKAITNAVKPAIIVVGYPRNQAGDATAQTKYVTDFARTLQDLGIPVAFQDESLTSVMAEEQLKSTNRPYTKGDIDAHAAMIILSDYLEANHGH